MHHTFGQERSVFELAVDDGVGLRTLHPDDAQDLFELLERNRARLQPWIHPSALPDTLQATHIYTIECYLGSLDDPLEAMKIYEELYKEFISYFSTSNPAKELGIWINGSLSGAIILSLMPDSQDAAEIGYWIDQGHEGHGIVTRCVESLMGYAIEKLEIERFVIGCAVENLRSRAVPRRLGYRLQGVVPRGERVGDLVYDREIYEFLSRDWRGRRIK